MLFRVADSKGKFIQYISLCVNEEGMQNGTINDSIMHMLQKSNIPSAKNITELNVNYYTWLSSAITIQCYDKLHSSIHLTEVCSNQRNKKIKAQQSVYNTYKSTSTTSSVFDGYYINTASTAATLNYSAQFVYTQYTTRTVI